MSPRRRGLGLETTDDAVLDGRLRLRQPRKGHRFGHDAILLAAATSAKPGEHAVELGAGAGAAGLALAARVDRLRVILVDIDPALAALAAGNAERNGLAGRVSALTLDVGAPPRAFAAAGLKPGSADCVLMNPPFSDPARQNISADARRRLAHAAAPDLLPVWVRAAVRLLRARGVLTLIWRADGLADVLAALSRAFGGVAVMPVHPKPGAPAIRILVRAVKESRSPLALYPGLVLNDEHGRPAALADAVLRGKSVLPLAQL
ncbi:MAG: methyltransferase [Xanthobacteraceae bacterium]